MSYQVLCKRTDFPKLGYICDRLTKEGLDWKFETDESGNFVSSFHADRILLVRDDHVDQAWKIMMELSHYTYEVNNVNSYR